MDILTYHLLSLSSFLVGVILAGFTEIFYRQGERLAKWHFGGNEVASKYSGRVPRAVRMSLVSIGITLALIGIASIRLSMIAEKVVTMNTEQTTRRYLVSNTDRYDGIHFYKTNNGITEIMTRIDTDTITTNFKDHAENFVVSYDCPIGESPYAIMHFYLKEYQAEYSSIRLYTGQKIDHLIELHLHPQQPAGL